MAAYEHHSELIYIERTLAAVADVAMPPRVVKTWARMVKLSRNGKRELGACASWLAAEMGIARSTFYEHRAILADAGLIWVKPGEQIAYAMSEPARITVRPIRWVGKLLKSEAWQRWQAGWKARRAEKAARRSAQRQERRQTEEKARNTGCPVDRTQEGTINNGSSRKSEIEPAGGWRNALNPAHGPGRALDRRNVEAREARDGRKGLGRMTELLALVPDAPWFQEGER